MNAQSIRPGTVIGGRTVSRAVNGTATFQVVRSQYTTEARLVTFTDGTTTAFELGTDVRATGWAEPLPAGGVRSKFVKTPTQVRASRKEWRGESVHGELTTREHDLIAKTNMFDRGRVNGRVGATRDGVGSVLLTGPSF